MQMYRNRIRSTNIKQLGQFAIIILMLCSLIPIGFGGLTASRQQKTQIQIAPQSDLGVQNSVVQNAAQNPQAMNNGVKLTQNPQLKLDAGLTGFSTTVSQDLQAYYNFNEGSGTSLIDRTGNNPNGTLINSPVYTSDSISGSSLTFDGSNNYVDLNTNFIRDAGQTISIWVKSTQLGVSQAESVMEQVTSINGHVSFGFAQETSNMWRFRYHDGNGNAYIDTSVPVNLNQWINLVIVKDAQNNLVKYYANGTLVNSFAWDDTHYGTLQPTLYLGALNAASPYYFKGELDEVRIYNRTLSSTEVSDLFTLTQTSSLNYSWIQVSPSTVPNALARSGMAYDEISDKVILFGGTPDNSAVINETWSYDYQTNTWTQVFPAVAPEARVSPVMTYDPDTGLILLFGGRDGSR